MRWTNDLTRRPTAKRLVSSTPRRYTSPVQKSIQAEAAMSVTPLKSSRNAASTDALQQAKTHLAAAYRLARHPAPVFGV